jgi:hypothetical protein
MAGRCPPATDTFATCATLDLLLKYPDETFATYETDETLKHACETQKHLKTHEKVIAKYT